MRALPGGAGFYNRPMPSLHRLRWLACSLLAWFVLSAGVAVASPFVVAPSIERICSGAGPARFRVVDDPGALPPGGHTLDCPLCTPSAAPPPPVSAAGLPSQAGVAAIPCLHAVHTPTRTAAPLGARGPPL